MKHEHSLFTLWLERWYRWTAPPMPSMDAPLVQRIIARRQRMVSTFLLISLFLLVFELPLSFTIPSPQAHLVNIAVVICLGLALFCNRHGWNILAGMLPIIANEVVLCFNILTIPGGLRILDLPAFDLFAAITLTAILLFPPTYIFSVALCNIGIICALLLLAPKTTDFKHIMATQPIVFVAPIFLQSVVAVLSYYGGHSALKALKETDRADELQQLYHEQARAALTDALTGLPNHRAVVEQLEKELRGSRRSERAFSLLFFDADRFKQVNDTYGHTTGDAVLHQLGERANSVLRDGDTLGRFGGEEFVILLPDTDTKEALIVAERIRKAVAATPMATSVVEGGIVMTISIGLSTYPINGETETELLSLADKAMYVAKQSGRNRVCMATKAKRDRSVLRGRGTTGSLPIVRHLR